MHHWFKRSGWIYLPIHPMGFITTLMALAFSVWFFRVIDRNSHSISDTLINFFVYGSSVAFWWKWLAEKTSTNKNSDT